MVPASDGWEEVEGLGKVQRGGDTLMWFHNPSLNPFFLFILLDFSKIQTPQPGLASSVCLSSLTVHTQKASRSSSPGVFSFGRQLCLPI